MNISVRLSRGNHLASAYWTLDSALPVFFGVSARGLPNQSISDTKNKIRSSVVPITFLQLPMTIFTGSMLRTTTFIDAVPLFVPRLLRTIGYCLGVQFFVGLVLRAYAPAHDAKRGGGSEREGAPRVPIWPVRGLILVISVFGAFACLAMIAPLQTPAS